MKPCIIISNHLPCLLSHVHRYTQYGLLNLYMYTAKKSEGNNHTVFWWNIYQVMQALNNIPIESIIQTKISLSLEIQLPLKNSF